MTRPRLTSQSQLPFGESETLRRRASQEGSAVSSPAHVSETGDAEGAGAQGFRWSGVSASQRDGRLRKAEIPAREPTKVACQGCGAALPPLLGLASWVVRLEARLLESRRVLLDRKLRVPDLVPHSMRDVAGELGHVAAALHHHAGRCPAERSTP